MYNYEDIIKSKLPYLSPNIVSISYVSPTMQGEQSMNLSLSTSMPANFTSSIQQNNLSSSIQ